MMDWDQAYRDHHDQVFWTLCRRTSGDAVLAEDLTQDTFVKAMRGVHGFTDTGRGLGPWLTVIALNLLRDHWKSHRVQREWLVDDMRDADTAVPSAEDAVVAAEMGRTVRTALARKCTQLDREALVLRFWGGCRTAEIARRQHRSESAVKTGECRGKQSLLHSLRHLQGVA